MDSMEKKLVECPKETIPTFTSALSKIVHAPAEPEPVGIVLSKKGTPLEWRLNSLRRQCSNECDDGNASVNMVPGLYTPIGLSISRPPSSSMG